MLRVDIGLCEVLLLCSPIGVGDAMVYRRKALPICTGTIEQQRGRLCNAYAHSLPFQAHNALALHEQMVSADAEQHKKYNERATTHHFIPARLLKQKKIRANGSTFTLPLPEHFIDAKDKVEHFEPRKFCHISAIDQADLDGAYLPRCGSTGLFFVREEVVDNLQAAALDLEFTSPFWLRSDHRSLQSGFLKIKDGCEPIVISLMTSVVGIQNIELSDPLLLHTSLRTMLQSGQKPIGVDRCEERIPRGMNAITGFVSRNKFVQNMPLHGLWVSLDQIIQHGVKSVSPTKSMIDAATLVEIDQWALYNADQLVTPGRLALRQSISESDKPALFQKL